MRPATMCPLQYALVSMSGSSHQQQQQPMLLMLLLLDPPPLVLSNHRPLLEFVWSQHTDTPRPCQQLRGHVITSGESSGNSRAAAAATSVDIPRYVQSARNQNATHVR